MTACPGCDCASYVRERELAARCPARSLSGERCTRPTGHAGLHWDRENRGFPSFVSVDGIAS